MRSLLLTGASGTFGRAFTKRLLADNLCDRICLLSRGEHAQAAMRDELGDDPRCRWFIGDVRDQPRLKRAMNGVDVVVHAAALKRIEVGHANPLEMCKTNIDGAINVIEAAQDAGVKKVVALSSDKAYRPVSSYGLSKAMAEALFLAANNTVAADGPRFAACRYGNIWFSAGSVGPKWVDMIRRGAETVPATSLEATRFYMTIDEAVDLVLNTIATMRGGELAIPDLPAYRLGDLIEAMGVTADVRGLPHWEKLHEGMADGNTSDVARRMSVAELREKLAEVGYFPKLREAA
jgi:UDP-N-acetylglucosamine 4,6-dehydratase